MKRIYLDNSATTAVCEEAKQALLEELSLAPANPSSIHSFGQAAKRRLTLYRKQIASYLKAQENEIFFTSGGTESMNLILRGLFPGTVQGHAISSSIEHACMHNTLIDLQKKGLDLSPIKPEPSGEISPSQVEAAIRPDTRFIALFGANGETGVKNNLEALATLAHSRQIPLFVDGVALLGREPIHLYPGICAMGFSGHKIHAPQGTGFAFIRNTLKLHPCMTGPGQEYGLRPGTQNLPGIAGLSAAVGILEHLLPQAKQHQTSLRDRLENALLKLDSTVQVNGSASRICNVCNLSFAEGLGEDLLIALDLAGIAVSHGSACSSGSLEPSRVLTEMGIPYKRAKSAIRFSLSRYTTQEEIDTTITTLSHIFKELQTTHS